MARVIINGDDFGMSESCTLAIARALSEGLISDTTMPANGRYFEEALSIAERQGFTGRIGIHLNLTEGRPLTVDIRKISDLVTDGEFNRLFVRCPRTLSDDEKSAVYAELCAQIRRLREAGIPVTHADSHHYVHTCSQLASVVAAACSTLGVKRIRLNRTFDTPEHPRITADRVDNSFWRESGFITPEHFGRLADCARMEIPDLTELLVHPDIDRSGRLIDRSGIEDGYPVGEPLDGEIFRSRRLTLIRYDELDR